ncbi:Receptor-like kinase [Melia azedarach]|uniref:Receptor-like kinase n=1 Tax=Melia azedarach TaxID=155640 RepID=A0ACC1XE74_MELAZ|nr:Receptor-like kinase [Melia azedarach]
MSSDSDRSSTIVAATVSTLVGVLVLYVIISVILYLRKVKRLAMENQNPVEVIWRTGQTMERFLQEVERDKPVRFTSEQLNSFTGNYKSGLGSGGFGQVYGGQFPNGVQIAVKVLNRNLGRIAEQQFMAEVGTIGRTYHINLVRLYGFCHDQHMTALVYEFMENGSLDKYLFNKMQSIEWEKLHEIAIGTAKGLAYLHEECQQRIIHYDIKPENVLLDVNFSPRVADFGLAKLCDRNRTHVTISGYKGTPGYSAPEFLSGNYPITHKCDVYSFGMVLFEIVGRRRNAIVGASETLDWFPKHVWEEYEKGELAAMISACGIEEKKREKAERTCMVALWCVQDSPQGRPPMSAVVKMLEGAVEVLPPPKPFRYLDLIQMTALRSADSSDGSGFSSESRWYKETTPIMAKHDIQMATC